MWPAAVSERKSDRAAIFFEGLGAAGHESARRDSVDERCAYDPAYGFMLRRFRPTLAYKE